MMEHPHKIEARRLQTRLFAEHFLNVVELPADATSLMDVGCAYGDALAVFRQRRPDLSLHGLDIEDYHLELARALHRGITFECADLFEFFRGVAAIDVIYCSNVLEHLYHRQAIQAARLMLSACRALYVMCPYKDIECGQFEESGERGHDWEGHRWVLDEHSFDELDADVDCRIIETPGAWPWGLVQHPEQYRQIIYIMRARV